MRQQSEETLRTRRLVFRTCLGEPGSDDPGSVTCMTQGQARDFIRWSDEFPDLAETPASARYHLRRLGGLS